jgi:hypothetical protein
LSLPSFPVGRQVAALFGRLELKKVSEMSRRDSMNFAIVFSMPGVRKGA